MLWDRCARSVDAVSHGLPADPHRPPQLGETGASVESVEESSVLHHVGRFTISGRGSEPGEQMDFAHQRRWALIAGRGLMMVLRVTVTSRHQSHTPVAPHTKHVNAMML